MIVVNRVRRIRGDEKVQQTCDQLQFSLPGGRLDDDGRFVTRFQQRVSKCQSS